MIQLTKDQIRVAVEMSWPGFDYMLEKFMPEIEQIAGRELLPEGFVFATTFAIEDAFFLLTTKYSFRW